MKRLWPSLMLVCLCRHRWWNFVSFTCWFLSSLFSSCSVSSSFTAAVVIFRLWLLTCASPSNQTTVYFRAFTVKEGFITHSVFSSVGFLEVFGGGDVLQVSQQQASVDMSSEESHWGRSSLLETTDSKEDYSLIQVLLRCSSGAPRLPECQAVIVQGQWELTSMDWRQKTSSCSYSYQMLTCENQSSRSQWSFSVSFEPRPVSCVSIEAFNNSFI